MVPLTAHRSPPNDRAPTLAVTALAWVYPLVTAGYFWADWLRFLRRGTPLIFDAAGLIIPANPGQFSLLAPWRVLHAVVTAGLLFSASRRLRQGAPGARAFSNIVLLGVLLPQVLWYGELSLDWFHGRGFGAVMLGGLAAVLLPAVSLGRRARVVEGWGSPGPLAGRVMSASVALGWFGFWAAYFRENLHHLRDTGGAMAALLATMVLAAAGMVGLYRQRAWGVLAATSSTAMLALSLGSLVGGRGVMNTLGALASSPFTLLSLSMPALVMGALLGPFLAGFFRKLVGSEPVPEAGTASLAQRLRVSPAAVAPAAPAEAGGLEDDAALAAELEDSPGPRARSERL